MFLEKDMAAELSQYNFSGLEIESTTPNAEMKFRSYIAWQVASKHATNSASIVKDAVSVYLALFHETAPPAIMKI